MILTIWRHGEAGRAATDRQRELTDKGFDDVGFGCHQFHAALAGRGLPAPDLVLFSRWVRTAQTAGIIASAFSHAPARELPQLRPGASVAAVEFALAAMRDPPVHAVLVSHQPLVSQLVDYLLGETGLVPSLPPGAFATLDMAVAARACASVCFWAAPPEYEVGT